MMYSSFFTLPMAASFSLAMATASGLFRISGGHTTIRIRGRTIRQMSPGTRPARAHVPQVIWMPASAAKPTMSGLEAMAVRNMAEMTRFPWKALDIRNEPMRRPVPLAGSLP